MDKNQTEMQQSKTSEDFEVTISSETNDGATLVTGYSARDRIQSSIDEQLLSAFSEYDPTNKKYSAFLSDTAADTAGLTPERLSELAKNPQSDLKSITEINNIARRYINTDDIIGRTYESIETNVNTDIRLSYRSSAGGKKAQKTKLEKAKTAVDIFNGQISLNRLIRTAIPQCYSEGNYIMYLRNIDGEYIADSLPLGVAVISDYSANGEPIVMVDIKELENRLKKTQL